MEIQSLKHNFKEGIRLAALKYCNEDRLNPKI